MWLQPSGSQRTSWRFSRPDRLADQRPHLDEASSAAPGISPGVVTDDEFLLRELYSPQHTDDGGGDDLTERAMPVTELIKTGVSVHRMQHVGAHQIQQLIDERIAAAETSRRSLGVARLHSATVRRLRLSGEPETRQFVVTDTGTLERPWHASIFAAMENAKQSRGRQLRKLLLPLLREHMMTMDEAYASGGAT